MEASNLDERTITLESEDGRSYACRILGTFDFEDNEYVLLEILEKASTVILQLIETGGQAIFRALRSDAEFERVLAYVKELSKEREEK